MKTLGNFARGNVEDFSKIIENIDRLKKDQHIRYDQAKGLYASGKASATNLMAFFRDSDAKLSQVQKRDAAATQVFAAIRREYGDAIADTLQAKYGQPHAMPGGAIGKTYVALTKDTLIAMDVEAKAMKVEQEKQALAGPDKAAKLILDQVKLSCGPDIAAAMQKKYATTTTVKGDQTGQKYFNIMPDDVQKIISESNALKTWNDAASVEVANFIKDKLKNSDALAGRIDMKALAWSFAQLSEAPTGKAVDQAFIKDRQGTLGACLNAALYHHFADKGDYARANVHAGQIFKQYAREMIDANAAFETLKNVFLRSDSDAHKLIGPIMSPLLASTSDALTATLIDLGKANPTVANNSGHFDIRPEEANKSQRAKQNAADGKNATKSLDAAMATLVGTDAASAKEKVAAMDQKSVGLLRSLALSVYDVAIQSKKLSKEQARELAIGVLRDQFALRQVMKTPSVAIALSAMEQNQKNGAMLTTKLMMNCFNGVTAVTDKNAEHFPVSILQSQERWISQIQHFYSELLGPLP